MRFNDFATSYNNNAFIQKDLIEWALPFINTVPIENTSILELGAGTGLLTSQLLKQRPSRIFATDISPSIIIEGKKNASQAHWGLMNAWDAKPESFDHIFSSSLLQWCPYPKKTIANWAKHLPQNATIHGLFFIDQTLKELHRFIPEAKIIEWRTRQTWESFFRNAGLDLVLSRESTKIYEFSSSLDLLRTLKYTGTAMKNQVCGGQLRRVLKEYDKQYLSSEGVLSTWQFCQIIVQKRCV